jgi:carbonic anhydrase/acetyltransferase-like protein (isoleucine patch superfamily)
MLYRFDGREPVIGKETFVAESALVIGDVRIGADCYIGHGAILRGDYGTIEIGNGTAVEEGVIIHAPPGALCAIGSRVTLGHGAIIHSARIGDSVTIGMGAILSIKSEVESWSIVAEGAIIKREQKVGPSIVVGGNPARKIRDVLEDDRRHWEWARDLYIDLAHKYCRIGMEEVSPEKIRTESGRK